MKLTDTEKQQVLEDFREKFTYAFTETDFLNDYQTRKLLMEQIASFLLEKVAAAKEEGYRKGQIVIIKDLDRLFVNNLWDENGTYDTDGFGGDVFNLLDELNVKYGLREIREQVGQGEGEK